MPTYTIIGATGATGGALIDVLLKDHPKSHINAYVRSKAKLLHQRPGLDQVRNVTIVEGTLSEISRLASVLHSGVDAAFCVTGLNENVPGMRIAQDTANAVVAALCSLNKPTTDNSTFRPPRLLFLSSASVNPIMAGKESRILKAIVSRAFSYNYEDLRFAEQILRLHQSWLQVTFVQPGGLTSDVQRGHRLSTETASEVSGFIGYLDLAAGMIEIAQAGEPTKSGSMSDSYAWKGISVVATSTAVKFEPNAPRQALRGLLFHYIPAMYEPCRALGLTW